MAGKWYEGLVCCHERYGGIGTFCSAFARSSLLLSIHRRHGHATADCHKRSHINQGDGDKSSHMTSHSGGQNPPAARDSNRCFKCNWVGGHSDSLLPIAPSVVQQQAVVCCSQRGGSIVSLVGATNGGSEDQDQRQVHVMSSPGATEDINKMFHRSNDCQRGESHWDDRHRRRLHLRDQGLRRQAWSADHSSVRARMIFSIGPTTDPHETLSRDRAS